MSDLERDDGRGRDQELEQASQAQAGARARIGIVFEKVEIRIKCPDHFFIGSAMLPIQVEKMLEHERVAEFFGKDRIVVFSRGSADRFSGVGQKKVNAFDTPLIFEVAAPFHVEELDGFRIMRDLQNAEVLGERPFRFRIEIVAVFNRTLEFLAALCFYDDRKGDIAEKLDGIGVRNHMVLRIFFPFAKPMIQRAMPFPLQQIASQDADDDVFNDLRIILDELLEIDVERFPFKKFEFGKMPAVGCNFPPE